MKFTGVVGCLSIMLFSFQGFAMPKVGDAATYKMEILDATGGAYIGAELQNSLVDYDKKLKKYKLKQIIKYETGKKDERADFLPEENFATLEQIQNILNKCIEMGYQKEKINLGDKEYVTCKVQSESEDGFKGYKWVAAVPFGYIKSLFILSDKLMMDTKLISFK